MNLPWSFFVLIGLLCVVTFEPVFGDNSPQLTPDDGPEDEEEHSRDEIDFQHLIPYAKAAKPMDAFPVQTKVAGKRGLKRMKRRSGNDGVHRKNKRHESHHGKDADHEHHDEHHDDSHSWKYYGTHGPSNWSQVAPACGIDHPRQTPINIRTSLTKVDETIPDLVITITPPKHGQGVTMTNNGHSVNVAFENEMHVSGAKLGSVFRVAGLHFHWGASDFTGSEHTVNGKRFPLEMHIVTYDEERFGGVPEALEGDNSLAVLGVFFTISEHDNPDIDPIIANLMSVQSTGDSIKLAYFDLLKLLPEKYQTHFYRYLGSLTTPPCSEVVIWTIFEHYLPISHSQVAYFRELYEGKGTEADHAHLRYNWRPIQPLHGRTVIRSFLHPTISTTETTQAPSVNVQHGAQQPVVPVVGGAGAGGGSNQVFTCPSFNSAGTRHGYSSIAWTLFFVTFTLIFSIDIKCRA